MLTLGRRTGSFDTPNAQRSYDREGEADLIRACRSGRRDAHEEFYRRYRRQVAATLYRVINDRREIEDLTQEVFIIAFRGLDRFRGDARISTWLYRICVNVALGRIRSKVRRPPPILMAQPIEEHVAAPDSPVRSLEAARASERVRRLLEKLPPKKRIVFFLHEIEGLDLKEIAEIVGAHPVTVRTRLFYARREFYRFAVEDGGPDGGGR